MEFQTISQTITDPADWDGSLFGTQLELVQLNGIEFRSSQTVTDLGEGVKLLRLSINQAVKVRSRPLSARYVATMFDNAHGGQYAGASVKHGQLLIMPPNFDFDASVKDGGFSCVSIFVPPEALESYYQTLVGTKLEPFDDLKTATPDDEARLWMVSWQDLVTPTSLDSMERQQMMDLQESLRDSALTVVTHSIQAANVDREVETEDAASDSSLEKARKLVRLAEDFANGSPTIRLRMVDLCKAADVSERTLQYAFKTCLGISPMNYLKRHRLHQVRHELKKTDPAKSTVSSVACQFGFFHFGDFSTAYKAQFKESPSETLRKA